MNYAKKNKVNPSKALITAMTKTFMDKIIDLGYSAGFYYNYDYKVNHYNMEDLKGYAHWYALYQKEKLTDVYAQQYSSSGEVNGINGNVDMNWIIDGERLPDPTPVKKTTYKKGDSGPEVVKLQKKINYAIDGCQQEGLRDLLKTDGAFGSKTEDALKFLQRARHITEDGIWGKQSETEANKKMTAAMKAVNFGIAITEDNSFTYGVGQRAHRGGCPFCGTNTGPVMKKKEKSGEPHYVNASGKKWKEGDGKKYTYEKTMCCNPYAFTIFAHGARDSKMLKKCRKGGNAATGMNPKAWEKYNFKTIGQCKNVPYKDLKVGDVIMCESHVWVKAWGGYLIEASGGNWSADSIRHKGIAKSRYEEYQKKKNAYVCRYKG